MRACLCADGGDGLALYSVKDRPESEGVRRPLAVCFGPLTPLTTGSSPVDILKVYSGQWNFEV